MANVKILIFKGAISYKELAKGVDRKVKGRERVLNVPDSLTHGSVK